MFGGWNVFGLWLDVGWTWIGLDRSYPDFGKKLQAWQKKCGRMLKEGFLRGVFVFVFVCVIDIAKEGFLLRGGTAPREGATTSDTLRPPGRR